MQPNFSRIVEIGRALKDKGSRKKNWHLSAILNKSKILSIGVNDYTKTHPKLREFKYHPLAKIHSELNACLKLGLTDCSGLTIVNIRIDKNENLNNSCYCFGCSNLVRYLGFKQAFFTDEDGNFQEYVL